MRVARGRRLAAAATAAVAIAGCGLGEGEHTQGTATLTVTRDYGATPVLEASVTDPPQSETVLRFLDREAEITTRYGGGFVHSIEGIAGKYEGGRSYDWVFYVDGLWSELGSAEREVSAGQRIWWDYRDWTDVMRVSAVVGSWPEPFAQAATPENERSPVQIDCRAAASTCEAVEDQLAGEGIDADRSAGDEAMTILVGPWSALRGDPAAAQLAAGPSASGVFVRVDDDELVALDDHVQPVAAYGDGAGLVAAIRVGEAPPTWIVTGTDERGVAAAAELLDADDLRDRYAVLTAGADELPLPATGSS